MITTDRYLDHIRMLECEDAPHAAPTLSGRWTTHHCGKRKLDTRSVLAIRDWSRQHASMGLHAQARMLSPIFGVSHITLYDVLTYTSWGWLPKDGR